MSDVWEDDRNGSWIWGALGTLVVHGAIAGFFFLLPAEARDRILGKVDFTVERTARQVAENEEPPPEEQVPEEKEDPVKVSRRKPAEKPAGEEPPPSEDNKKPPPKFQMSGQTFAGEGSWDLAAEVGDGRFGSLGGEGKYDKKVEEKSENVEGPAGGGIKKSTKVGFSPAKPEEVKEKPQVVLEQQIPYPPEARKLGIEGKVRLRVDVDRKGRVVKVEVLQDPGGGLGQAAAKAIKGFLFSPAIAMNGKPVDYRLTYIYVFKLE
jgi:protein TonB